MAGKIRQTWEIVARHAGALLAVVWLFDLPYYGSYVAVVRSGLLPKDATDYLFGFLSLFLLPLSNGMLVYLVDQWWRGRQASLWQAFQASRRSWMRLLTSYVTLGFVMLGWLVLTVGPVGLLALVWHQLVGANQPVLTAVVSGILVIYGVGAFAVGMSFFLFLEPLVVVEGLEAWEARRRSTDLGKGRRLRVAGLWLLVSGPCFVLNMADMAGDYLKETYGFDPLMTSLTTGLASSLLYVVPVVFFYLYYRDLSPVTKEPE